MSTRGSRSWISRVQELRRSNAATSIPSKKTHRPANQERQERIYGADAYDEEICAEDE